MHRNQLGVKFMNGKKKMPKEIKQKSLTFHFAKESWKNETFCKNSLQCDRKKHLLKVLITDITKVFIQS